MRQLVFLLGYFVVAQAAVDVYVASSTNTVFSTPDYTCTGSNDHIIIQDAVNAVRNKGGTVWLSDGLFSLSSNVYLYSKIILRGQGKDATILQLAPNSPSFAKAGFIRSINCKNLEIRDMTIDGNSALSTTSSTEYGRYGVYTEACNYTTFDNLKVINWFGYGLDPHGAGGTTVYSNYVTITNCDVSYNGWDGIALDKSMYSVIARNNIINNGRHGINVCTGSKFSDIHDNYVKDNGFNYKGTKNGCGIMVQNNQGYDTRDHLIQQNQLINSYKGAFCLTDVENIELLNNKILETNICLRVKTITDITSNNIIVENNICNGKRLHNDTIYTGTIPTFLPVQDAKSEYIVAPAGSSELADFYCTGTNDESTIMKAMTYFGPTGGTITLLAGTFNLNNNLHLISNVILKGQGIDVTILRLQNNAMMWKNGGKSFAGMLRGMALSNIIISDLTMDGNRYNQPADESYNYGKYGFYCEVCNNVQIKNVKIARHWGYGVDPHGTQSTNSYSDGFTIENSIVEENGWDGITIDQTLNTIVKNNIVKNNGRHGVNIVTGSKQVLIDSNTITNNGFYYYTGSLGCGIAYQNNGYFGTSDITTQNNTILNSATSSICIRDVDNTFHISNYISGPSNCMRFQDSAFIFLDSNTCANNKKIRIETPYSDVTAVNQTSIVYITV